MHIVYTRYQIGLDLSNVKGTLHRDRILPPEIFRLLQLSAFYLVLPFSAFFRLVLSPSFSYFRLLSNFLLSSTFCRHLFSVASCLNAAFCRHLLSAFFPSWVLCRLLPHTASRLPKTSATRSLLVRPSAPYSRILLYASICNFLSCADFCLVSFSAFCCS